MSGQQRHRIFIAINLPKEVRRFLANYEQKWRDLPAKWTPQENLHITLAFLGNLTDVEVGEVCMIVKAVCAKYSSVDITLSRVGYGPDEKLPPKMVWASGEKIPELSALKNDLEEVLLENINNFAADHRGFSPHVTLAKVKAMEWRAIEPEERPEITDNIDLIFTVESIDVMESEMKRGGPEYTVIESIQLQ